MNRRGFSLIELMIAMVVLAIGVLATMAMQFSALDGYSTAREVTGSVEAARTVEQLIRAEARQWNSDQDPTASTVESVHEGFDRGVLAEALANDGSWVEAPMAQPVTQRLNDPETTSDDGPGRFCIYLRARSFGGQDYPDYTQVQVAVVYPRQGERFGNGCGANEVMGNLGRSQVQDLELEGYRVNYFQAGVSAGRLDERGGTI